MTDETPGGAPDETQDLDGQDMIVANTASDLVTEASHDVARTGVGPERRVLLLNGVNLGLLGTREPAIYGTDRLDDHVARATRAAHEAGMEIDHLQSDSESALVGAIAAARRTHAAIIINPGAFTHYSWAIHDALAAFDGPVVELHLSNPISREAWRHTSVVSPVATALIAGMGGAGYEMAVLAVAHLLANS
ncbi:MAG: type II 3-dehydroquinate dehydratase [Microthrixaceae bacterium]